MPAKGSKILVSGANGYIAMWVVRTLLERGYFVRGTVRSLEKGQFMTDYFQKLGFCTSFEFVVVEDIIKDGAFDDAVKDVDAIEHTASPCHFKVHDPQELIGPAVEGTLNMLRSALEYGTQVKRIVITSSSSTVMSAPSQSKIYTEKDWNIFSIKEVEALGDKTSPGIMYCASKTLAEQAAWEFYEKHKSKVVWDLVTILPSFVFGPPIHDIKSPSSLNFSLQQWYDVVTKDTPRTKEFLANRMSSGWVDVRDTALGHVLALEKEEAGGERIIVSAGNHCWQGWLNTVNSHQNPASSRSFPKGYPKIPNEDTFVGMLDTTKEQRILGIKYRTKSETAKDTLEYFTSKGW